MAVTPKKLYVGQPGTTATTLYTVLPGTPTTIMKNIALCNTTNSAVTFTLYLVPSGGAAGATNMYLSSYNVAANDTVTIDTASVLNTGDFIAGLASVASSITTHISGVEVV